MKVVAINGSPHKEGNTYHALRMVGSKLEENGIEFEIIHVGNKDIRGCMACGKCRKTQDSKCSMNSDPLNEWIPRIKEADGIIISSPVYFSGVAGTMKSFLDRLFYVSLSNGNFFRHKVGAAVVAVRRTGGSSTLDTLNHYLSYSESVQIMETLGENMAWQLKMREATKDSIPAPARKQKVMTSFIR